ncbi:MAG: 1-(5-phosphoribosyl)-5-[(5-phosphoribosylamino)methylideneamino]imidazole-4-carboxamide isomerase [Bacteroidetes bacterium]|nr:1-(5-phosphoribosyl)-5-[(5-phosphoribosylamino)methylideneamino]imidazole-4-carboxamide isomerase [Bacteroidota bacterium]
MYPEEEISFVQLEDDDKGLHLGLYRKRELVSVISLFIRNGELQFRKFATKKAEQNKGYGTALMNKVFEIAKEKKCKSVWCNARGNATKFYTKWGMIEFGSSWVKYGLEFIIMKKEMGMQIIPAIDIIDGKCVRLTEGDYSQKKIYNEHPLEVAKEFEDAGLSRLHLVDLDGAKAGSVKNWKVLEAIAGKTSLVIDFGGGIKTDKDVQIVLNSGAVFATIGSIAVKDEEEFVKWLLQFGANKFLLGADVKEEKIAVSGWLEKTDIWVYDFIEKYIQYGVQQVFCTDVSKDGKLEGPSVELYKNIITKFPHLHFIASGGVSAMKDVETLYEIGCKGVIIGKAIYENRISLHELKAFAYEHL